MRNLLLKSTLAASALLLQLATPTSTHDLRGGGCFPGDWTEEMRLMEKKNAALGYHVQQSDEPVQGLHIALEGPLGLRATWMNPLPSGHFVPVCLYGAEGSNLSHVATGYFYTYKAGMFAHTLNSAVLDLNVIPCLDNSATSPCVRSLSYRCGDRAYGFSDVLHVQIQDKVVPLTPGPKFAIVGDLGVPHGRRTIDTIASRMSKTAVTKAGSDGGSAGEVQDGVQMLLHAGDICYANHYATKTHNNSYVWVDYMNSMQSVAAKVPYMTTVGNHEAQFDFAAYLNWLPMPSNASGSNSPFWFSFDYLGVHVLAFSSEHDFSPNSTQHRWIQQDLKRANENRARVPWVLVMAHRPLYCTSLICRGRCVQQAPVYRSYLEDLLYQQRVDVVIAGHNHQYERSYPVYRSQVTQKDFTNPKAPVYIVNGAAGCPELNDPTFIPDVKWRAADHPTLGTGWLLMTPSASQLKFEYVLSDFDHVIDSFTIVRT